MSPSLFMGYLNSLSLDRQFSQYIYKVFLDGFVILDGLREGNVYHFIVVNAYHDIALSFHDGVDGGCAQTAGKDTVVCRRATTALQVTEDGYAYVILGVFVLYTLCIVHCTAGQFTLGYQYDTAVLGFPERSGILLFQSSEKQPTRTGIRVVRRRKELEPNPSCLHGKR